MKTEIESPENSGKIQPKGKYKKGCSGNPNGKSKGARNKSTLAVEASFGELFRKDLQKGRRRGFERQHAGCKNDLSEEIPKGGYRVFFD